jgi:hypothetical protein
LRKQRYLRMSIVVSLVADDTEKEDELIRGITEDMQYQAEMDDVCLRLEQAYEIPPEMGQQYFSIWRK